MRDAPRSWAATPAATEQFPTNGRKSQHRSRELMLRQNRLRRLRASITVFFGRLLAIVTPRAREVQLQRMCPFCGLITPRYKTCCLECGKSLELA
jgi:hypothetical protein